MNSKDHTSRRLDNSLKDSPTTQDAPSNDTTSSQAPFCRFYEEGRDGMARAGYFETSRGRIQTPIFMPVGTVGSVKSLSNRELTESINAEIILGNTYHLYLRPGLEVIRAHGGLHEFMNWKRPILTDSGGYQVFSLKDLRKIEEEGVYFQDHIRGETHLFSPEKVIEIEETLGSNIMMAFDECPPHDASIEYMTASMARTTRWAKRCLEAKTRSDLSLFGILQGGINRSLREKHAEEMVELPFDGFAIGGLSVGEKNEEMYQTVAFTTPMMPDDKPKYLMGVGKPIDIVESIARGVDMFDCVLPTRNARNGQALTSTGPLNLRNAQVAFDLDPIDTNCACPTCQNYSRSYIRHLFKAGEMLAGRLVTEHNLFYYLDLVRGARRAILEGRFLDWRTQFYQNQSLPTPPLET